MNLPFYNKKKLFSKTKKINSFWSNDFFTYVFASLSYDWRIVAELVLRICIKCPYLIFEFVTCLLCIFWCKCVHFYMNDFNFCFYFHSIKIEHWKEISVLFSQIWPILCENFEPQYPKIGILTVQKFRPFLVKFIKLKKNVALFCSLKNWLCSIPNSSLERFCFWHIYMSTLKTTAELFCLFLKERAWNIRVCVDKFR